MVLTDSGALGKIIAKVRWMPETTFKLQTSKDPNAFGSRQDCGRWEVAMFCFVFNFKIRFIDLNRFSNRQCESKIQCVLKIKNIDSVYKLLVKVLSFVVLTHKYWFTQNFQINLCSCARCPTFR